MSIRPDIHDSAAASAYLTDKYGSDFGVGSSGLGALNDLSENLERTLGYANPMNSAALAQIHAEQVDKRNATQQFERQMALQEDQQAFNAEEARIARDWTERLANTAYQRSAADLKAAGLNPWLAVQSPASSAGGVAASSTQGQASRAENTGTSVANTGIASMTQIVTHLIDAMAKIVSSGISAAGSASAG